MSNTDIDEPSLSIPNTENAEPMRAKLRSDIVEPSFMNSNTATAEPKRAKLRRDNAEANCV